MRCDRRYHQSNGAPRGGQRASVYSGARSRQAPGTNDLVAVAQGKPTARSGPQGLEDMNRTPMKLGLSLMLAAFAVASATTANLRWDNAPATAGLQDGAGNWGNRAYNTNWLNGTLSVAWVPGATAVIGSNLTANATITITNAIVAGRSEEH